MNEPCYYRVSIKGLAVDDSGRLMLLKEENGKWELPGGGLEHDEDPIVGLKREIQEEMGLVVTFISPTPKYFITCPGEGKGTFTANVIYEIKLKDLNFVPSDECVDVRHFTIEEARKENLFPNVEKLLEVYNPKLHV